MQTPEPVWSWQQKGQMVTGGFLISGFLLFNFSCTDPTSFTPPDTDTLSLRSGEPDLTELNLELQVTGAILPAPVTLTRGGEPALSFSLHQAETTLTVAGLAPSTDYTWQALLERTGKPVLKSMPLKTRTMDTTSHELTWKVDSLPGYGYSSDIAIINENNIWVVGRFSTEAFGSGDRFNAYQWDGITWNQKKIVIYGFAGDWQHTEITSILGFSESDIWVVSGSSGSFSHYDGNSWAGYWLAERTGGIKSIWGLSSNNLYIIGTNGSITHWDGNKFRIIPPGTTVDLNHATTINGDETWITGLETDDSQSILLKWDNVETKQVGTGFFNGIWGEPDYYKVWIYHNGYFKVLNTKKEGFTPETIYDVEYWIRDISGSSRVNIFLVGDFGAVYHYNGSTVKFYHELLKFDLFRGVSVTENMMVACGELNYRPYVLIGNSKQLTVSKSGNIKEATST